MTDHYREAKTQAEVASDLIDEGDYELASLRMELAQVHATLALVVESRRPHRGDVVEATEELTLPARQLIPLAPPAVEGCPIVSCPSWDEGRPVRVLAAIDDGPDRVSIRWQDVAANRSAVVMSVLRDQQVRLISGGGQ